MSPTEKVDRYKTSGGGEGEATVYKVNILQFQDREICIKTQHVDDLTQNFQMSFSQPVRERQQARINFIRDRVQAIKQSLPETNKFCGAIVEIKKRPSFPVPPEADPKVAWRIGAMQANYLNQHIHRITEKNKAGKTYFVNGAENKIKNAVSDLLRQFGIFPEIHWQIEEIDPHLWLTCFHVIRRTKKTTAKGKSNIVVMMLRVNPFSTRVEMTTSSLWEEHGAWFSCAEVMQHLLTEDWDPSSYIDELDDDSIGWVDKSDVRAAQLFVTQTLRDCLSTPIGGIDTPRVLFMSVAQNSRRLLPFLQNPNLPYEKLPDFLDRELSVEESDRLWIVRLRSTESDEVPNVTAKDGTWDGSRASGIFRWQNALDRPELPLYLSIAEPSNSVQNRLKISESRLDDGEKMGWNAHPLEIALVRHPGIEADRLANFIHFLRDNYPYYAKEVYLPFPFPFVTLAKEYAVGYNDEPRSKQPK